MKFLVNETDTNNKVFFTKLIFSTQQGFTLIELLVVVILVGILAAVSLPSLVGNIGKSRETEATINLGILSRSQQSYHFETRHFSPTIALLHSNVALNTKYYNFPNPSIATDSLVKHQAIPVNVGQDQVKNYAAGIYHNAGDFDVVICQGKGITAPVEAPNTFSGSCSNGGRKIR